MFFVRKNCKLSLKFLLKAGKMLVVYFKTKYSPILRLAYNQKTV